MNKKLVVLIRSIFLKKLQSKTGRGRLEIEKLFEEAVAEASLEVLDAI